MAAARRLSVVHAPGTEAWSKKMRKRARELVQVIDSGYWELAKIIYEVWNTKVADDPSKSPVYTSWGYRTYTEWAGHELGLENRQVYRLKGIWQCVEVELKDKIHPDVKQRLRELGMSRVRELVRVISEHNVEQWVELAEHLTHEELSAQVSRAVNSMSEDHDRETYGIDPPTEVDRRVFKGFKMDPEQVANMQLALQRAEQVSGTRVGSVNIDLICTDFLATNDHEVASHPHKALRYLAKFERLTGKRLIVVDPKDWEVEYGMEALEKMASRSVSDE